MATTIKKHSLCHNKQEWLRKLINTERQILLGNSLIKTIRHGTNNPSNNSNIEIAKLYAKILPNMGEAEKIR